MRGRVIPHAVSFRDDIKDDWSLSFFVAGVGCMAGVTLWVLTYWFCETQLNPHSRVRSLLTKE